LKDYRSAGNYLKLMHFDDAAINYANHPVKLVFAVPNAQNACDAIVAGGGHVVSAPAFLPAMGVTIAMAADLDGYLLELIEISFLTKPVLTGIGIGVSSLQASDDIYTRMLSRKFDYFLHAPGFVDEIITISPHTPKKGIDVVVMHYFTSKNYADVPVKLVFTVDDPVAFAQDGGKKGLKIVQMPSAGVMGVAKDTDGYEIQIVPVPAP